MRYRPFGTTDLKVSEIGIGCARIGGIFDDADRANRVRLLRHALDAGVTFFDTSDLYSLGESERLVGEALGASRHSAVVATKVGYRPAAQRAFLARAKPLLRPILRRVGIRRDQVPAALRGEVSQDFSSAYIVQSAERSLRRLGTDYIDLYQLHSPPREVIESGEFLVPLERLRAAGKIRYYGVSCETTTDALLCLDHPGLSSVQVILNLLEPGAAAVAIPRAAARGIAVIARQCYAGGVLARETGAANVDPAVGDEVARLRRLATAHGRRLSELALQYPLGVSGVSVTLVGIRTEHHLEGALADVAAPPLSDAVRRAALNPAFARSASDIVV